MTLFINRTDSIVFNEECAAAIDNTWEGPIHTARMVRRTCDETLCIEIGGPHAIHSWPETVEEQTKLVERFNSVYVPHAATIFKVLRQVPKELERKMIGFLESI